MQVADSQNTLSTGLTISFSYAAELQTKPPNEFNDDDLRKGKILSENKQEDQVKQRIKNDYFHLHLQVSLFR